MAIIQPLFKRCGGGSKVIQVKVHVYRRHNERKPIAFVIASCV